MNRYLASGLGMTLGLLAAAGRADDVIWHAPGDRGPRPAVAPTPIATPTATGRSITARAAIDDAPAATPVLPAPAPTGVPQVPHAPIVAPHVPPTPTDVPQVPPPVIAPTPIVTGDDALWHSACDQPACVTTGQPDRAAKLEVTGEYLLWWGKRANQGPPLLTTSPPNGVNGVPGAVPGSTVLLSAGDLDKTFRDGGRLGLVYWLDECATYGFDGRIFGTISQKNTFQASSNQYPNGLFRPFFIANPVVPGGPPVGEFREVVTAPGSTAGRFIAENKSQFWGAEANWRDNLWRSDDCGSSLRVDLLAGFRYLNLNESLTMTEDVTRLVASTMFPDEVAGTHIVNRETFATSNNFYGGQLGTVAAYRQDKWTVDMRATVALGTTQERLDINGSQVRTIPGGPTLVLPGGLLALPTNIGSHSRDVFAVVPEIGMNAGYQVTDHIRAFAGYNFLYWSNVIRPGDQIDRSLDVNNIPRFVNLPPGTIPAVFPPRPEVQFKDTSFWAQGVNLGVEFKW